MEIFLILPVGLVVVVGLALAVASSRWQKENLRLLRELDPSGSGLQPDTYHETELEGVPEPVARYLRMVLPSGRDLMRTATLAQEGEFFMESGKGGGGWRPFTAAETMVVRPAGFLWNARIDLAWGLHVKVRDGFVLGRGIMKARLLGGISLVSREDRDQLAAGALHRFLAEAVWCPSALLPSQGTTWEPLDERSARATLSQSGTTVTLDFFFGDDGLVERVYTDRRGREVKGEMVPTPWQGRFGEYREQGGVRIPFRGEVEWLTDDGPRPYWRGRITRVEFSPGGPGGREKGGSASERGRDP